MRLGPRDGSSGPLVLAELGVNHDGDPARALDLVRAAADAGADAVKFQFFRADLLMSRASRLAAYQASAGERDPRDMLRRLELPLRALADAADLAHRLGLAAVATVFSVELVGEAAGAPFDAFKTASPDIVHRPLLEALGATGRPLILSTGASTLGEVARALTWLRAASDRLALLQCVSAYPTPDAAAALGGMAALRAIHRGPVGYSDHTTSEDMGAWAVAAGAAILEKHLTHDRAAPGPDHAASLDPAAFARYAAKARAAHAALGPPQRIVAEIERDVRQASRQSIVAARALPAGHVLRREDLAFKRPGTGLAPWLLSAVVGTPLARAVEADAPLAEEDLLAPGPAR